MTTGVFNDQWTSDDSTVENLAKKSTAAKISIKILMTTRKHMIILLLLCGLIHTVLSERNDIVSRIYSGRGPWGDHRPWVYCLPNTWAMGFRQRVEGSCGKCDDTALNAIQLECAGRDGTQTHKIQSYDGMWGSWGNGKYCSDGQGDWLVGASFKVEGEQGGGDDTAANACRFKCSKSNTDIYANNDGPWGTWYGMASCPPSTAICGFSLIFEYTTTSKRDDTAANGADLACCRIDETCAGGKPCSNGGVCEASFCNCSYPYQGPTCEQIAAPDATGICIIFGDPHLRMFNQYPGDPKLQYLCTEERTYTILQNKLVSVKVTTTRVPFFNEKYEIDFFADGAVICSLGSGNPATCSHPKLKSSKPSKKMSADVVYLNESLRITIKPHVNSSTGFDMAISSNYPLIHVSSGLCVSPAEGCDYEGTRFKKRQGGHPRVGSKLTKREPTKRELIVNLMAEDICKLFVQQAKKTALGADAPTDDEMLEEILIACIFDTETTGDSTIGSNSIYVALSEAINDLPALTDAQYENYVVKSVEITEEAIADSIASVNFIIEEAIAASFSNETCPPAVPSCCDPCSYKVLLLSDSQSVVPFPNPCLSGLQAYAAAPLWLGKQTYFECNQQNKRLEAIKTCPNDHVWISAVNGCQLCKGVEEGFSEDTYNSEH
ncbi:unnamed protein product [Didymodactylos carnosus]|uniref:EGF-like domain-containing protein n=1 Tax=Didymodactylos carnosus TaxID=1234261 RepID=A0A814MRZ2_9BILA|nr:unnamed protein product [Didymodactylos carnosus]CAF3848894.1 unnamed protein product [Didymodactylos carnosus]